MTTPQQRKAAQYKRDGAKIIDNLTGAFSSRMTSGPARPVYALRQERYSRDMQRGKVYDVEQLFSVILDRQYEAPLINIAGSTVTVPLERRFGDLPSIQRYVDHLTLQQFPGFTWAQGQVVLVTSRRGEKAAHYQTGSIHVPDTGSRWALRQLVILHEFAHHLATVHAQHGPLFVHALRTLLEHEMGPEAALIYTVLCQESGVRM